VTDGTKSNRDKLKCRRCYLNIREHFLTMRVTEHRLPTEAV